MIGTMQITTLGVRTTLSLAICLLAVTACVYEIPIQQGNFLDATALVQVKKGMTRAQVRYLLGTPMVPGGFDNDRWDYDYYLKLRQLKTPRRARAAVYFHNDLVDHVDSDVMPVATDAAIKAPANAPAGPPTAAPVVVPASEQATTPTNSSTTAPIIAPASDQTTAPTNSSMTAPIVAPPSDQATAPATTPTTEPIIAPSTDQTATPATPPIAPPASPSTAAPPSAAASPPPS